MTPRYLPVSTVAAQLGIGPRRLRTLLAAGRIPGAYRLNYPCRVCSAPYTIGAETCHGCNPESLDYHRGGHWLIPADYRVTPPPHLTGPARDWGKA